MNDESQYKLVAIDMDGTLLNSSKQITPFTLQTLAAARPHLRIAICTGRALNCISPYERCFDFVPDIICCNGAVAMIHSPAHPHRQLVYQEPLPQQILEKAIHYVEQNSLVMNVYDETSIYAACTQPDHEVFIQRYIELTGAPYTFVQSYGELPQGLKASKVILFAEEDQVLTLKDSLRQLLGDTVHLVHDEFFVEILHPSVNKGNAIRQLCDHLEIEIQEVIAFGDGNNDAEMLHMAGLGIAMKNARDHAKQFADRVSEFSNDEDAVAKELIQLFDLNI